MFAARMHDDKGGTMLLLALEPGNFEKLKSGQPIHKFLNEFIPELQTRIELLFVYTPDPVWVMDELKKLDEPNGLTLVEVLQQSLTRPPVVNRGKSAEDMKKVF